MKTDFDTLKTLATYTINHLIESNMIDFDVQKRGLLIDSMATELGVSFATDEDIKDQAIEEVEEKMGKDNLPEDITESEMYNHARKEIIKAFSGENIAGLYLVESLHKASVRLTDYLLTEELIDDVYGSDDEIQSYLVNIIRGFSPKRG